MVVAAARELVIHVDSWARENLREPPGISNRRHCHHLATQLNNEVVLVDDIR